MYRQSEWQILVAKSPKYPEGHCESQVLVTGLAKVVLLQDGTQLPSVPLAAVMSAKRSGFEGQEDTHFLVEGSASG